MKSRFPIRTDIPYFEMESVTAENGKRQYQTPYGPAPSVTTILSTLPHPGLDEWRERVGPEEAARVSLEATTIGSAMHDMLECHVRNTEYKSDGSVEQKMAKKMFMAVRMSGLRKLNEVWGIEVPLHFENLYAGRTDLVGLYNNIPSIIDYKTSKHFRIAEWLVDYKTQVAGYSLAHNWMFPDVEPIQQGVLLIGTRPNPEYNIPPKCQIEIIGKAELEEYQDKWIAVLDGFYASV